MANIRDGCFLNNADSKDEKQGFYFAFLSIKTYDMLVSCSINIKSFMI